jgi:hypothetical protein
MNKQEYPKRMLESIKAVKEKRRLERLALIKAATDHVKSELAKPSRPRPNFQRPSTTRVATIQDLYTVGPLPCTSFPYTRTKRARRYLKKHLGFPVDQHPMGLPHHQVIQEGA